MNDMEFLASGTPTSIPSTERTWSATWTRAVSDMRAGTQLNQNVTLRLRLPASIGGEAIRLELQNIYGVEAVAIGEGRVSVRGSAAPILFDGQPSLTIPVGATVFTDPLPVKVGHGDQVVIDLYLPEQVHLDQPFLIQDGCTWEQSEPGNFVGHDDFPAAPLSAFPMPPGVDIPISVGGPFIRTVAVLRDSPRAVVVCLGDSITASGWPQRAAALLSVEDDVAILNRGIAGNSLRLTPTLPSFGRPGLERFDDDVLKTEGVTDVLIALGINDISLPGALEPEAKLPSAQELINDYRHVMQRATDAGVRVTFATITPFFGADEYDEERDAIRNAVNTWIRQSSPHFVDLERAVRADGEPAALIPAYDGGDHLHPGREGQNKMAEVVAHHWALPTSH